MVGERYDKMRDFNIFFDDYSRNLLNIGLKKTNYINNSYILYKNDRTTLKKTILS